MTIGAAQVVSGKRPNWSRFLPRALVIPGLITLRMLHPVERPGSPSVAGWILRPEARRGPPQILDQDQSVIAAKFLNVSQRKLPEAPS